MNTTQSLVRDRETSGFARDTSRPIAGGKEAVDPKARFLRQPGYIPIRRRILVVDDDTSVRESIARVLEEQDYDVIVAATAREAISIFIAGSPDLVLLDLNMPDEDGWEIFRTMHKLWPFVPVIIVTARPHQAEPAANSGVDALMEKPLDFPVLLNAIKELLSEPERQRLRRGAIQDKATFRFLSKPGIQTSGHLTMPSSAPNNRTGPAVAHAAHTGSERNCVLLVDDDPSIREFLGRALKAEHYDVVLARDGQEAAAKYLVVPYDLALLDLSMPRMDGWEVLHTIQLMQPLLPVIIITARPHQYERAVQARVDALMEKPLDLPLLLKTIRELLAQSVCERVARLHDQSVRTALLTASQG